MNTSMLEIARTNRIIALAKLRQKRNNAQSEYGNVLRLQSTHQKRQKMPLFVSTRVHRFEERIAA